MLFRRNPEIESAPMQAETMLFNPASNKFCLLNTTASFVWNHLEDAATSQTVGIELCRSFSNISADQATEDVEKLVSELQTLGFVHVV